MNIIKTILASLALSSLTTAIQITSPSDTTLWSSGTSGQTVSWQAVSTDATSFVVQLVNQAGFLTNSPVTLIANQSTGAANTVNSATVTFPSGAWPTGTAFQINLMSSSNGNPAILAQSQQFNITSGGASGSTASTSSSSSSSSSSGTVPTTISMSSTMMAMTGQASTVMTVTSSAASGSSGDASGGIPNAITTASTGSASSAAAVSVFGVLLSAAGLISLML